MIAQGLRYKLDQGYTIKGKGHQHSGGCAGVVSEGLGGKTKA